MMKPLILFLCFFHVAVVGAQTLPILAEVRSAQVSEASQEKAIEPAAVFSPLNYPSSMHSLFLSPQRNFVNANISRECIAAAKPLIEQGQLFSSAAMKKYITPLSAYPEKDAQDFEFFHYTLAPKMKSVIERKAYEEIFTHLRTVSMGDEMLYIAAEPFSSKNYGPIKITIYFSPEILVFYPKGLGNRNIEVDPERERIKDEIEEELIAKYPVLAACANQLYSKETTHNQSILVLLAAESEGVSLIAYYGVNSWMQVLGPWAIKDAIAGVRQ